MERSKKTTILFSRDLFDHLTALVQQRKSSVGELVREACRRQYGQFARLDRLAAIQELAALQLPVDTPEQMELESVPSSNPLT